MLKKKCGRCGKVIEGHQRTQVDYMMAQHQLTHQFQDKRNKEKEGEENEPK